METPATRASWHAHRQLEFVDAFWGADLVNAGYKFICLSLSLCPYLIHLGVGTVNTYENKNLSPRNFETSSYFENKLQYIERKEPVVKDLEQNVCMYGHTYLEMPGSTFLGDVMWKQDLKVLFDWIEIMFWCVPAGHSPNLTPS